MGKSITQRESLFHAAPPRFQMIQLYVSNLPCMMLNESGEAPTASVLIVLLFQMSRLPAGTVYNLRWRHKRLSRCLPFTFTVFGNSSSFTGEFVNLFSFLLAVSDISKKRMGKHSVYDFKTGSLKLLFFLLLVLLITSKDTPLYLGSTVR